MGLLHKIKKRFRRKNIFDYIKEDNQEEIEKLKIK